ncbi:reverse transcriptase domain-containing protein [Candidatus Margulisiibacteriota bacterium]
MSLIEELSQTALLRKCWKSIYAGKNEDVRQFSRGVDNISLIDFKLKENSLLPQIAEDLSKKTYQIQALKAFPVEKGLGKYRLITAPTVSDRIVHKAILSVINKYFYQTINTGVSYCGVKKNIWSKKKNEWNNVSAIKKLMEKVKNRYFWVLESDIKGFFDSVPKYNLLKQITSLLPDSSINCLLEKIVYFEVRNIDEILNKTKYKDKIKMPEKQKGISQGSPLSPLFSNIYLSGFDNKVKDLCGDSYIRYVDDFLVLADSKEKAKELKIQLLSFVDEIGLELAEDKTEIVNLKDGGESLKFLGLRINNKKICAKNPGKIKTRFDQEYLNFNSKKIRKKKTHSKKIELINYMIAGCANFYRPFHCKKLLEELNMLIRNKTEHKKLKNKLLGVRLIDINKVTTSRIINEDAWRAYFQP